MTHPLEKELEAAHKKIRTLTAQNRNYRRKNAVQKALIEALKNEK
jgi:multidrug resistance efflux pump